MTCKNCICFAACKKLGHAVENTSAPSTCSAFKDKDSFLELPCKLGTKVFRVLYINTADDEYYCHFSKEWVIRQGNFNLEDIEDFGKTVFLTKEEADTVLRTKEKENAR